MSNNIFEYIYKNKDGIDAVKIVRQDELSGKKIHREHLVPELQRKELQPYRFCEIADSTETIFLVEGEKCTELLISNGLKATTTIGGANAWKRHYAIYFENKDVIIIPDNDNPGRKYAENAQKDIYSVAKSCHILDLDLAEEGDDIVQYFESGNTVDELLELSRKLQKKSFYFKTLSAAFAEIEIETKWIVDNLLIQGGASLVVGKPKKGKTTLAQHLTSCISSGQDFLGFKTIQGKVLYLAYEEHENEFKKKFRMMDNCIAENIFIHCGPAPDRIDLEVERLIKKERPALVVLDTLFKHAKISDINDYSKVDPVLAPIVHMARRYSIHILTLHHCNKSSEGTSSILGSTAIHGNFDNVIMLDSPDSQTRFISTDPRYGKKIERTQLVFNENNYSFSLGKLAHEERSDELKLQLQKQLENKPDLNTEKQILSELKCDKTLLKRVLNDLMTIGTIKRLGKGVSGNPFTYCLAQS